MKRVLLLALLLGACSSSSASDDMASAGAGGGGAPGSACPNLAGTWTIAAHCVGSFVGQTVTVTQSACSLTFAAPFDGYSGAVDAAGKLNVMGPTSGGSQMCSGTGSASTLELACADPCAVS